MQSKLLRALESWTERKGPDGIFWIFDLGGNFYKFFPDRDRIELIGKNWRNGEGIWHLRLSPGGTISIKYGYGTLCTYGLALSKDGSSVFTHVNGAFAPRRNQVQYARPSIFHIHIPATERAGDSPPANR